MFTGLDLDSSGAPSGSSSSRRPNRQDAHIWRHFGLSGTNCKCVLAFICHFGASLHGSAISDKLTMERGSRTEDFSCFCSENKTLVMFRLLE